MISRRDFTSAIGAGVLVAMGPKSTYAQADALLHRSIPSSGEKLPIVGVGTNRYGVGTDSQLRAPLKAALRKFHELGGTVIDTAPGYRTSENVLGDLTHELGIGDDLFIATKVDVQGRNASEQRMEQSFSKLNKSKMELMQVHNLFDWENNLALIKEWQQAGRIRYIGVTTSRERDYETVEKIMCNYDLDFIQINYSLANQRKSAERILPMATDRGMAVLVNRPFGGGGVFKKLSQASMPEWAAEFDANSWAQFLLKYVLSNPAVTCAIPGMTKERHVVDNLAAAAGRLPNEDMRRRQEAFFDGL